MYYGSRILCVSAVGGDIGALGFVTLLQLLFLRARCVDFVWELCKELTSRLTVRWWESLDLKPVEGMSQKNQKFN
jgi:hypothetical protein